MNRWRRIGIEKEKVFYRNFDSAYDWWKEKALKDWGFSGSLFLVKERGKVIIYIPIGEEEDEIE